MNQENTFLIKAICKVCKKEFLVKPSQVKYGWGKYCSRECTHRSQQRGDIFKCFICGKEVHKSPSEQINSKSHKHFCSKSCQIIWRNTYFSGKKHTNWKGGVETYRKLLINSNMPKNCVICKINNIEILTAHHIDHNRKNNQISNLTWLCLNCHYLVHHHPDLDTKIKKGIISWFGDYKQSLFPTSKTWWP